MRVFTNICILCLHNIFHICVSTNICEYAHSSSKNNWERERKEEGGAVANKKNTHLILSNCID